MDCQSYTDIHGIPDRVIARCMFKLTVPGCPWIVRVTLTFMESLHDRVIARCMFKLTVPGCPWIVRVTLTFVESLTG